MDVAEVVGVDVGLVVGVDVAVGVGVVVCVDVRVLVAVVVCEDVGDVDGVDVGVDVCEDVAVVVRLVVGDVVGVVIWQPANVPSTYESNAAFSTTTLSSHEASSFSTELMEHDTLPPVNKPIEYSSMMVFSAPFVAAQSLPPSSKTASVTPFGAAPHLSVPALPLQDSIMLFSSATCTPHRSAFAR